MIDKPTLADSSPEEYVDLVTSQWHFCAKNGISPLNFDLLCRFWDFFADRVAVFTRRGSWPARPAFPSQMAFVATV
jgi:hypothetical protein